MESSCWYWLLLAVHYGVSEVFGRSARVGVSWAFVHPVGTHIEDTFKKSKTVIDNKTHNMQVELQNLIVRCVPEKNMSTTATQPII